MANEFINVADVTPRIAYTATSGQTAFTVPYVFFACPGPQHPCPNSAAC